MAVDSLSEQAALKTASFAPMFSTLRGRTKYSEWNFGAGTGATPAGAPPGKGPGWK